MKQAFLIDQLTGVTRQRFRVATTEQLAMLPAPVGTAFIIYNGPEDIDTIETYLGDGEIAIRSRTYDAAMQFLVAKNDKREQANIHRNALWGGSCMTPLGMVDCDETSRGFIQGAINAGKESLDLGIPYDGQMWTMADNSQVFHTLDQLRLMGVMVAKYISDVQAVAKSLKDQIDAPEDDAALAAIDIGAAPWPTT